LEVTTVNRLVLIAALAASVCLPVPAFAQIKSPTSGSVSSYAGVDAPVAVVHAVGKRGPLQVAVLVGNAGDGYFWFRKASNSDDEGVLPNSMLLSGGTTWLGPFPLGVLDALAPTGQIGATVGTTGCWVTFLPGGTIFGPVSMTHSGGDADSSLSQAVAEYKAAVEATLEAGWFAVPCPGGGGTGT